MSSRSPFGDVGVTVGVESEILAIEPRLLRARVRLIPADEGPPLPAGDALSIRAGVHVFEDAASIQATPERPVAAGAEMEAVARAGEWTCVQLPLPPVLRRPYLIAAKVFSADPRYRRPFSPSRCHVVKATLGNRIRVPREVVEELYGPHGYGNPLAEEQLRQWIRAGIVVAVQDGTAYDVGEIDGRPAFHPLRSH